MSVVASVLWATKSNLNLNDQIGFIYLIGLLNQDCAIMCQQSFSIYTVG